jgi:hypothetical protein
MMTLASSISDAFKLAREEEDGRKKLTFPLSSLSDLGVLRVLELSLVDGPVSEK